MITPGHGSSLVTATGKERPTEHLTRGIVSGRKGTKEGEKKRKKGVREKGKKNKGGWGGAGTWNGEKGLLEKGMTIEGNGNVERIRKKRRKVRDCVTRKVMLQADMVEKEGKVVEKGSTIERVCIMEKQL